MFPGVPCPPLWPYPRTREVPVAPVAPVAQVVPVTLAELPAIIALVVLLVLACFFLVLRETQHVGAQARSNHGRPSPPNHLKPRPIAHPISLTTRKGNGKGEVNVSRTAKSAGITSKATSCASPLWASRSVIGGVPLRTRPPRYWPTNPPTPLLTHGAPRLGIRQQRSVHGAPPLRKELPARVIPLARRAPSALLGQQADPLLGASAAKAAPDVGHRPHQRMAVHSSEAAQPHVALHARDGVTSAFTSSERPGPLVVLLELVVLVAM